MVEVSIGLLEVSTALGYLLAQRNILSRTMYHDLGLMAAMTCRPCA